MPNSSDQFFLKESIPLYKKISDYELLLNQLVYKIDKSTLNLDQISDTNKTNDYTLLQKIIDLDSEITDKFPYKKYDEINKSYETIKTELDETNGELKDKILMTLYKNYKKLNEIKSFQSKTTLLKDIPLNTVINYSQRLSKFTSKPQITIIDQSIIGEDIPQQQQQQQDPSGWNFIWAGDDMIRRGNLVVQQQQSQIKQEKIKLEEEAKQLEARKKQQEEENHNKMAATAAKNAGDGMIFDGKHKEVDEVPEQENKVDKDEEIASDADADFDLDLFNPDEF